MKYVLTVIYGVMLLLIASSGFVIAQTNDEVTSLVEQTAEAIEKNALQTLARINRAEHPYMNKDDPSLYVFVLDTYLTVNGHPIRTKFIGRNLKGKPDVKGKMFRDEFLAVARKYGSGWVDYHFLNPKTKKQENKTSFIKLVKGSDGKEYIVGCGKYYHE
jgi:signal transduction histidine kinase